MSEAARVQEINECVKLVGRLRKAVARIPGYTPEAVSFQWLDRIEAALIASRSPSPQTGGEAALLEALEEIIAADTHLVYKSWRGVRSSAVTEGPCAEIARAALAHPPASGDA